MAIGNSRWCLQRWTMVACCFSAVLALGCGDASPPPPETYAVAGTVYDNQGKPLSGGIIQFISQASPALNMSSIIAGDGTYKLITIHGNENLQGAIAGDCQVLVTLPFADGQVPQTITLPKTVRIDSPVPSLDIRLDQGALPLR